MEYAVWLPREGDVQALVGYGDSDWANDKVTRKSVSSGVLFLGGCVVMDWSRPPSVPARSSGEAEWCSQVALASEGLHMKIIIEFLLFDKKVGYSQYTDSTAAKAIGGRQGSGKLRHLECGTLWLQQRVLGGDLWNIKVNGENNPSDLGTKVHPDGYA